MDAHSVREKQGLVPDLQIDDPHYARSRTSVSPAPTPTTTVGSAAPGALHRGVAKKQLNIVKLVMEKAAWLGRDTFGVDGAHGPWQQRLAEIGGTKPLAFGQFGEQMGPSLEALLAGVAKWGGGRDGGSISGRKPRDGSRSTGVPLVGMC
jgi:hypothetical protein